MVEPGVLVVPFPCLALLLLLGFYHDHVVCKSGESPLVLLLGHVCAPRRRRLIGCCCHSLIPALLSRTGVMSHARNAQGREFEPKKKIQ
jgi:hypothetical protein